MAVSSFKQLAAHTGHDIECVIYGDDENAALECTTCNVILVDFNNESEHESAESETVPDPKDEVEQAGTRLPLDYGEEYREGRLTAYYQPHPDHMPENMWSFEVYGSLENGIKDKGIPQEHWVRFDCKDDEPIEAPLFLD